MSETIRIASDDPLALASLHAWLLRSPEVTRHGLPELGAGAEDEYMADAVAVIALVVSSVSALADILSAYRAWRETRAEPPVITIAIDLTGDGDEPAT